MKQREIRDTLDKVIGDLEEKGLKHNDDYDKVGIGDIVESVLLKLGITQEKFKEFWGLSECACNERKKWLNGLFYWHKQKTDGDLG